MRTKSVETWVTVLLAFIASCSSDLKSRHASLPAASVAFGPEQQLGNADKNPSTPYLRYSPDGRLFAVWTEDHDTPWPEGSHAGHHAMAGDRGPSPMRNAMLAWSTDDGKNWSTARRINSAVEAIQGEENGPKIAFTRTNRALIVWSIPGGKGDKTRANIRFSIENDNGDFTAPRTLNEVADAARFPIIEPTPGGDFLVAWIDRRLDQPHPRQLYLMRLNPDGVALTKNYKVGEGLCECCKLGISFADDGKTVYMVDREVDANKIRNHVLRKSTDGGNVFAAPVEISKDGWQVPTCPHSGPSIGQDSRGHIHVSWFTQGRSEEEAGIYYSVSKDDGKTFAPRTMIDRNTAPETLYNNLAMGDDDTVYFVWSNLDAGNRAQIYMRTLASDGQTWSSIQQISTAKGNAGRTSLAIRKNRLQVAWTETDGEQSKAIFRNMAVQP